MNIKRIVINLFFVIICGLVLTGCNGKSDDVGTNELVNELEEVFNEVFANLDLENITEDIALPEQIGDVTFNWVSSDRNILSNDGKVNRVSVDKETTIKAFVIKGDAIKEFSKQITVKGRSVDDYIDFINNVFVDEVYGNIDLPKKAYDLEIIWSSSNSDVLTSAGKVKRERDDTEVVLTASFNYNGIEKELEKNIIVKGTFNLEDYLSDVLDTILVDSSIKKLEDNLVLPLLVQGEYIIEWSIDEKYSSNARIEYTDDGRQMIVITRPEVGESYFNFELTATINKGLTKVSRIWTDCYVKPKPAAPNTEIEEVFDLPQESKVCVEGTVTYVNGIHGFWIEDETGTLYVYVNQEHEIKTGYTVKVTGEKDLYYSLLEIRKPFVEIIRKGEYNYQNNLINSSVNELADSVPEKMEYTKEAISVQGKFYKVSGRVIDDPNGKYTYAISDDLTGKSIVVYDSVLEEAVLNKVGSLKGKYIECVVLFNDFYSTGFARVVPILETIKEVDAPVITDDVKIANTKAALEELLSSKIDQDVNLYTSNNYEGVSISWTSSNETVLDNAGKIGSSSKAEEKVTLTAVIKAGEKEETVEFEVTVVFVNESTVLEVLKACDEGEQTVVFTGKVIALDNKGYFYVADNTGVIYVRTVLTDANVGDSVNVTGTAKVYKGYDKQYTRQVEASSVTKVEKEIEVVAPQKVNLTDFPAVNVNGNGTLTSEAITMIKETSLYGGLLEITGYLIGVADRGYTDHYISSENSEAGDKIYVYHGNDLTEVSKFEGTGKLVTIVCPVYDVQGADGFRLGTPISITEVK